MSLRRSPRGRLPADILVVFLFTALVNFFVFVPSSLLDPLRIVFGIGFMMFVPGYAITTALFPRVHWDDPTPNDSERIDHERLDPVQRIVLSVALSVTVAVLVGLGLNYTPWGVRLVPIMVVLNVVILASLGVSYYRRPFTRGLSVLSAAPVAAFFRTGNFRDNALNVVAVVSFLVLVGTFAFVLTVPSPASAYTEFYLLTADEDGGGIADAYPSELAVGESTDLIVGVQNNEHEVMEYTVVVQLLAVDRSTEGAPTVEQRQELDRIQITLADNETLERSHRVTLPFSGEDLRLQYLLYRGQPPEDVTRETAYRETHIWLTVTA